MKNYTRFFILSAIFFVALSFLNFTPQACASITPTLTLSTTGDGDSVKMVVNGDPSTSIIFYHTKTNVGPQLTYIGTTDSSGYFTTTISSSSYGIASSTSVHVVLGGINGTSSADVAWPYVSSTSTTSTITLSQTGLVMSAGSSSNITVSNNSASLYLSNNSNPSVANLSLSSTSITVTANTVGSTVATVCAVGSTSNCASIYITVQNTGVAALNFSVNNITVAYGSNAQITISGGTGSYYVLSNSNSSVISTAINASIITLTANANSGSASITVCSTNMSSCGIITATASSTISSYISFSQNSPTISAGESTTVTVSGSSGGTYYISNNSNSGIATATISGSTITLHGVVNGSTIITVCSSLGSCGTISVTVSYTSSGGNIALSQSSLSLLVGQAVSITITGGATPYNLPVSSNSILQASLNSNVLTVYGISAGTSLIAVCSSEGGCTSLNVTVNSSTSSSSSPSFSQSTVSLNVGTSSTISVYGTGSYFIYNNTSPSVASAQINGSTVVVNGLMAGTTNVSICQGSSSYCSILYVTVTPITSTTTTTTTTTTTPVVTENYFSLSRYLGPGDKGDDVLQLQKALVKLGLLSATPNGYYGVGTTAAVKKFQKNYSIRQTGNVGPSTKNAIEILKIVIAGSSSSTTSSTATTTEQMAKLQALIESLKNQIKTLTQ